MSSDRDDFMRREFPMRTEDYDFLRRLAVQTTGIELSDAKKEMVYSRLVRRIRALHMDSFATYCRHLEQNPTAELSFFVNAITTNLTSFFREGHHFEAFRTTILPDLVRRNAASRKLRIWSAACSTGEEPYSIAMSVLDSNLCSGWDIRILATDIDSNVLAQATAGRYVLERVQGLASDVVQRHFIRVDQEGVLQVRPTVENLVSFRQLNLMQQPWPMTGLFDVVFCRNVVIYFSKDTQRALFNRIAEQMPVGGYLCIGHSETMHGLSDRFDSLGRTMYRKRF